MYYIIIYHHIMYYIFNLDDPEVEALKKTVVKKTHTGGFKVPLSICLIECYIYLFRSLNIK